QPLRGCGAAGERTGASFGTSGGQMVAGRSCETPRHAAPVGGERCAPHTHSRGQSTDRRTQETFTRTQRGRGNRARSARLDRNGENRARDVGLGAQSEAGGNRPSGSRSHAGRSTTGSAPGPGGIRRKTGRLQEVSMRGRKSADAAIVQTLHATIALLWMAALIALCAGAAFAQEATGSITGKVADPSGAAIAGASVIARDVDRGTVWPTSTNQEGVYSFSRLPIGRYEVK